MMRIPGQRIHSFPSAKIWLIVLLLMVFTLSCEKWIDPDINVNPNEPADVTMEVLLSYIEADVAFRMAGGPDIMSIQAIWLQQLDGIDRQALAISNYSFSSFDVVFTWDYAYSEILMDAKVLAEKAAAQGSPYNSAVAGILTAITLGQLTDAWDAIPWSEALQGNAITQPVYDRQESVYEAMQMLLDRAIDSLSVETDQIGIRGDYYYNGNPVKWLKAAHALKARYYLHLSKRIGDQAYVKALEEIPLAFLGNEDDLQFNYGKGETESNPLYQFMQERDNVRMGAYLVDMMKASGDPRLETYALPDDNGEFTGSTPGQTNVNASRPGPAFAAPDAPTYIVTYVEMLFTKAEALLKTGADESLVRSTLAEAVTASLAKFAVADETWLQGYAEKVGQYSGETLFEEIMTQKYIATFYQPEAYHSWRRTGYPVLLPNPGGQTSGIPRRFVYPISEQVYNQNTPTGFTIMDPVWWDE